MPIPPQTASWLQQWGYQYHCFISWPLGVNQYIEDFADKLHTELIEQLAFQIPAPRIYLNDVETPPGANWPNDLQQKLCRSLCMVALCAPIYFDPSHRWCGLEWAAMEALGRQRLGDPASKTIIPIKVSEIDNLPVLIEETHWIDVSAERLRGRSFLNSRDFRSSVAKIVARIERIADVVRQRNAVPACDGFEFPQENAFSAYHTAIQDLPLTGAHR